MEPPMTVASAADVAAPVVTLYPAPSADTVTHFAMDAPAAALCDSVHADPAAPLSALATSRVVFGAPSPALLVEPSQTGARSVPASAVCFSEAPSSVSSSSPHSVGAESVKGHHHAEDVVWGGARSPSPPPSPMSTSSSDSATSGGEEGIAEEDGVLRAYAMESPSGQSPPCTPLCKRHNRSPIVGWLRAKVSQNKVRFREDNYDLDLTYITPRIVAMGYPAHGTEYYIRNPIDSVEDFFFTRHPQHFCVYNLCAERHYDRPNRFHGRFKCFPFDDHNAPPLALMCDFVDDAVAFLNADPLNVVAIHCKAGKGRTGLMTSCLLLAFYPDQFSTAQDAARFFDAKRTNDGRALTIPSQQRYVGYYEIMLKKCGGRPPPETRSLSLNEIRVDAPALRNVSFTVDFYFTVATHNRVLLDSRVCFPNGPVTDKLTGIHYAFSDPAPTLTGDIKLTFYRRKPFVLSGKESHAFYTWFNTDFCDDHLLLHRQDLDKVDTSAAGKDITLEILLQPLPYKLDFTF